MRRSAPTICKILRLPPKEAASGHRLTDRAWRLWRETMNKKMYATPAIAGLLALPIAGYTTYYLMQESPFAFESGRTRSARPTDKAGSYRHEARAAAEDADLPSRPPVEPLQGRRTRPTSGELSRDVTDRPAGRRQGSRRPKRAADSRSGAGSRRRAQRRAAPEPMAAGLRRARSRRRRGRPDAGGRSRDGRAQGDAESKLMADSSRRRRRRPTSRLPQEENRDRVEEFKTNPIQAGGGPSRSRPSRSTSTPRLFQCAPLAERRRAAAGRGADRGADQLLRLRLRAPESTETPFESTVRLRPRRGAAASSCISASRV